MTWRRLIQSILRLYPAAWRDRYGQETAMVVDDLLADARRQPARLALNLFWGMAKERVHPTVAHRRAQVHGPPLLSPPSLMRHRDALGGRTLNERALALLEPDEHVVGTFDAVTDHPYVRHLTVMGMALSIAWVMVAVSDGGSFHRVLDPFDRSLLELAGIVALLAVAGLIFCRLTGVRTVMYALTTQGLVVYDLDRWRRPRSIINRSAAVAPEQTGRHRVWRRTAIGDSVVWVHRSADSVIFWARSAVA
jgi:hypothetical protein